MKTIQTLRYALLLTLILLLSACSSRLILGHKIIEVNERETVVIRAVKGYDSYMWSQVLGTTVEMVGRDDAMLRFRAPEVENMEELVFALKVSVGDSIREGSIKVVVLGV